MFSKKSAAIYFVKV